MRVIGEKDRRFNRALTLREILSLNLNVSLYAIINSNRHLCLRGLRGIPVNNVNEVVVTEYSKVPLYKQAMQIQMGKQPKTEIESHKVLTVRQINIEEATHYKFEVYIAR